MLFLKNIDCREKEPMFNSEYLCCFVSFCRIYYFSVLEDREKVTLEVKIILLGDTETML